MTCHGSHCSCTCWTCKNGVHSPCANGGHAGGCHVFCDDDGDDAA